MAIDTRSFHDEGHFVGGDALARARPPAEGSCHGNCFSKQIEREQVMTEMMVDNIRRPASKSRLQSSLVIAAVALVFGATGLIYGRRIATGSQQSKSGIPLTEIIVSKDQGLLFRSEDGTPLLKIGKDSWGAYVNLLSSNGRPIVKLTNVQDTGGIIVGSKDGSFAYMQAQEDSATITLIGKYGKEAVEITSGTPDGSGNLSINEGKKGYHAVEIGAGPNRVKSKGTITIPNEDGAKWQAP
jgi:hypothetical protein